MRKEDLLTDAETSHWFSQRGVMLVENVSGSETEDSHWLKRMGILKPLHTHLSTSIVTGQFLGGNKDFGGGWHRGGGESFYKIVEVNYRGGITKHKKLIAFKAVHSMGNIKDKALTEAAWMAQIAAHGRCGQVYCVGGATIIKDFLEEDSQQNAMSPQKRAQEEQIILNLLQSLGLHPLGGRGLELIQHKGKLMLIDLGSGDISGPSFYTFIAQALLR